ncbi:MAG: hypothetical protein GY861_12005 [bacterium]|nr:hypothetical protein [bacterium]
MLEIFRSEVDLDLECIISVAECNVESGNGEKANERKVIQDSYIETLCIELYKKIEEYQTRIRSLPSTITEYNWGEYMENVLEVRARNQEDKVIAEIKAKLELAKTMRE